MASATHSAIRRESFNLSERKPEAEPITATTTETTSPILAYDQWVAEVYGSDRYLAWVLSNAATLEQFKENATLDYWALDPPMGVWRPVLASDRQFRRLGRIARNTRLRLCGRGSIKAVCEKAGLHISELRGLERGHDIPSIPKALVRLCTGPYRPFGFYPVDFLKTL